MSDEPMATSNAAASPGQDAPDAMPPEPESRVARARARRERPPSSLGRVARTVARGVMVAAVGLLALFLITLTMNGLARWNARRVAQARSSPDGIARAARNNLLVIGLEGNHASGLLALKVDPEGRVYGIAIPDGAFMEVPGQGFERIGDSYDSGPKVSEAAISNYFSVPFQKYVVVDLAAYRAALENQDVSGIFAAVKQSDLERSDRDRLAKLMGSTPTKDVAIVALPVTAITLGDQTYFEPQRDKVADLLKAWWGVDLKTVQQAVRVIIYNGSGSPGVAGAMGRQLIRLGYKVVDTRNADRFDYKETLVILQHGANPVGEKLRAQLGAGKIVIQQTSQQIADVIVVVGKDYAPKATDG